MRTFIRHESSLFHPDAIERARKLFNEREAMFDGPRSGIGSASDQFRLTWDWFNIWGSAAAVRVRPYELILYPPNVRRLSSEAHSVPWHQDAAYINLMKQPHRQVATVFVPLDLGGPGVEFDKAPCEFMHHEPENGHGAVLLDYEAFGPVTYDLQLGDALFFGDLVPHRTIGTGFRRSIEFRLILREDAIEGKDYWDLSGFGSLVDRQPSKLFQGGSIPPARTKRGRPRLGESRPKPWIDAGMSRATYYRRKKEGWV